MNSYAKKNWAEDYKGDYNFSNKENLQKVATLFFADYEIRDELEKKYGKHDTGAYELNKNISFHNMVQVEKDNFSELLESWKLTLEKLSGKPVQKLIISPENKHNPSKEFNEITMF